MTQSFDYIVVGAGSAGCVLANRLTEDGATTVLLLEAGGQDDNIFHAMPLGFMAALANPAHDWGFSTEHEPHLDGREIFLPRGRVLGGSSTVNGMIYMRGAAADYDEWRDLGCAGWGAADVLPYFRRMETSWRGPSQHHGHMGPLNVRQVKSRKLLSDEIMAAAEAAGYARCDDLSVGAAEGVSLCEVTINAKGRRASTSRAYLRPALSRGNLQVHTNALAQRVLFDGKRATGVSYRHYGALKTATANKEIILSGGAYNSPQLLMLSGIGPAAHLREHGVEIVADSPNVGRNLQEHPIVYAEFAAKQGATFLKEVRLDRAALSMLAWIFFGAGSFSTQITSCTMLVRTQPDLPRPDIQLVFLPIRLDARVWTPGLSERLEDLFSIMVIQLHPEARGEVALRSADPADKPRIKLNLLAHERDYAELRRGIEVTRRIFAAEPLASLVTREMKPGAQDLDAFIKEGVRITQHPCGSCRMGSDAAAVLDPELRVKGVQNLRVVDASIMPTITGGNINAPVIMIAEKAADMIRGLS